MTAAKPCAALTTDGINLINKDDARCGLLRLFKKVTHARGTDTDEHLDKVRPADRKELHPRLTGNRLRKEGLTRARGTKEQHALRDARAEFIEFIRRLEEFDDLLKLLLRLIRTCDISERHLFLVAHHQAHT